MTSIPVNFQRGYIVGPRSDLCWFLFLPFVAVAAALLAQQHLPVLGLVLVIFAVTVPHHGVTWLRVYGSPAEFGRWRGRLIAGPLLFIPAAFLLLKFAPISLILLVALWDHQHSIMQQYGFGRIYDFKAATGSPATRRFDLYLHWTLFVNLLLVSPVFTIYWVRMLHMWHLPVSSGAIETVHLVSWSVTGLYGLVYLGHLLWCVRRGTALNPSKYLFLVASYFLWYFTAFATTSLLVWSIAHRSMHGGQYLVMVFCYNRNNVARSGGDSALLRYLGALGPLHVAAFLLFGVGYALVFWQLSSVRSLSADFDLLSASLISSFALLHYYFDSFIWKVRTPRLQRNL